MLVSTGGVFRCSFNRTSTYIRISWADSHDTDRKLNIRSDCPIKIRNVFSHSSARTVHVQITTACPIPSSSVFEDAHMPKSTVAH